ncbi:MAG: hypothetical protein KZQ95_19580 [Candidatus Thiodiazotropha sp. (ex Epidulcina cf. delphinae)]|nr:hypothetical protein [Candidatus Thiodiazotropha sp. (ex Epidulcina cf. delphinae)]
MTESARLRLRLTILAIVGGLALWVDPWAKENAHTFISLVYLLSYMLYIGTDISEYLQGQLKVGPEIAERERAINMPFYRVLSSIYLLVVSVYVFFSIAENESAHEYLESPLWVWMASLPLALLAFIAEYRANEN